MFLFYFEIGNKLCPRENGDLKYLLVSILGHLYWKILSFDTQLYWTLFIKENSNSFLVNRPLNTKRSALSTLLNNIAVRT